MDLLEHVLQFLAILIALVVVFVCYENWYWHRRNTDKTYGFKEVISNFSLGASYKLIDALAIAVYVFFLYDLIKPFGLNLTLSNSWLSFLVVYIIVDFFFFLTHLLMHKVRWFWTGHVTHHSSNRYNYSVALRQNFTVTVNGALLIWWIPCAFLGFDKEMVLLAMELNLLYQFLLHTEMPSILDKFGAVMNCPSHHRVHHGYKPEQIDTNFAGTFIIWDKLFGTFVKEQDAGELGYGITRNQPQGYYLPTLLFHEWRDMFRDFRRTGNIKAFIAAPGWIDQQSNSDNSKYNKQMNDSAN